MKFRTIATIENPPVIRRITTTDVLLAVLIKMLGLAIVVATIGGFGYLAYRYSAFGSSANGVITSRDLDNAESAMIKAKRSMALGKAVIMQSNLRLSNAVILSRLFSYPYPEDNSYSMEKFLVLASALTQPPIANSDGTKRDVKPLLAYTVSMVFTCTSEGDKKVEEIGQQILKSLRPDFTAQTMPKWEISSLKNTMDRDRGEAAGNSFDRELKWMVTQPKGDAAVTQIAVGSGQTDMEKARLTEIANFYSR